MQKRYWPSDRYMWHHLRTEFEARLTSTKVAPPEGRLRQVVRYFLLYDLAIIRWRSSTDQQGYIDKRPRKTLRGRVVNHNHRSLHPEDPMESRPQALPPSRQVR